MALEFHQYLRTCELSEFCATQKSSLANLVDCNKRSASILDATVSPAVLCNPSSNVELETGDRTCTEDECMTLPNDLERLDSACLAVQTNREVKQEQPESCGVNYGICDSHSMCNKLNGSFNTGQKFNDSSTTVIKDKIPNSYSTTESHLTSLPNATTGDGHQQLTSDFNNIYRPTSTGRSNITSIVDRPTSSRHMSDDAILSRPTDNSPIATIAHEKPRRSCQRQLSLPASYLSFNVDRSFKEANSRRRRHSVRFADEMGEMLSTVITIPSNEDELVEAYSSHRNGIYLASVPSDNTQPRNQDGKFSWANNNLSAVGKALEKRGNSSGLHASRRSTSMFNLCFEQPSRNYDDFLRKLQVHGVCLESARTQHDNGNADSEELATGPFLGDQVQCNVKVKNIHACKSVVARYTEDDWETFTDVAATYRPQSIDELETKEYDTFVFTVKKPEKYLSVESSFSNSPGCTKKCAVEFAIRYQASGLTFWDNNAGKNYRIVWNQ